LVYTKWCAKDGQESRTGFSLRDLSEQCNLSINAISKIERGENSPTVSSLHKLSTALGVHITDLFKQEIQQFAVFTKRDSVMRTHGDGLVIETLGRGLPHQQLEPYYIIINPKEENRDHPSIHSGEEFIYCLEGELDYYVDDQEYHMKPGDSLLFKATRSHSWNNPGESETKLIMVFQIDQFQPIPHRQGY
jgi:transcriptional regulator with XRE-family HTH domain